MRLRFLIILLLATPRFAVAAPVPDFSGLAYQQRPGAMLPLQDMFHDDTGRTVRLADVFEGKPLILALGYFLCPNLCSVVRADLFHALLASGMIAGRDYTLTLLSIDPAETSATAASAKADLGTITVFFFVGGVAAALIRYNLIVPQGMIGVGRDV
jgi:protein SCO1